MVRKSLPYLSNQRIQSKVNQKGFTIIEVMIVLAIAGLILLIVFLAVPALQRNQRNTARKKDISRVAGAIIEQVYNTAVAGATLSPADNARIAPLVGTLTQYTLTTSSNTLGAGTTFEISVTGGAPITNLTDIRANYGYKCSTNGAVAVGTIRQVAIQYASEVPNGPPHTALCVDY